ncbi:MAG: transporter [Muribaculaceae bacterium]|nr:transporter [Muribaculaceae bacterium]
MNRLKPWILPIAMVCGVLLHNEIDSVQFLAPYLIFTMLFITFCRIRPSEFKISRLTWQVVLVQVIGALAGYIVLAPVSRDLAQGCLICILCPTATAAPVITAMLGGSITTLVSISILSNIAMALLGPIILAAVAEPGVHLTFTAAFSAIITKVAPMIIGPMAAAFALLYISPRAHKAIAGHQGLSFYIWAVSLILVVGRAVSFAMAEPPSMIPEMIALAIVAGVACALQFYIGRRLGHRNADPVAGAQGLGQKNTVLAVWLATSYLNPVSSIAPAAYIAWQNTVNSLQLYYKGRRDRKSNIITKDNV